MGRAQKGGMWWLRELFSQLRNRILINKNLKGVSLSRSSRRARFISKVFMTTAFV